VTYIDHPLTNENPNAIVFVTQNWNPGGIGDTYNNDVIGVWYDSSEKKWSIFNQDILLMPEDAAFNVLIPSTGSDSFVHTANGANSSGNVTYIDNTLTNGNPDATVLITQNWNPGGGGGNYNSHPVGVWYSNSQDKWAVFNQDIAAMPIGAAFNVMIPSTDTAALVHTATAENIDFNVTYIDHPLTNNNPNAILLVTQNWNPGGVGGTYNDHPIGVWYSSSQNKWAVFNQDIGAMPIGAAFNVMIPTTDTAAFVHTATAANIFFNYTLIDHPLTNNNPNAILLVTQNWNPGGGDGIYNDHPIGVWYSDSAKKWSIFIQDNLSAMPIGAAFNVLIPVVDTSVFVHFARTSNIVSNWTYIDHPLTNENPNAILFVTQNWNPSGIGNVYNDQPIGVWYDDSEKKWGIFNQDFLTSMPDGAAFNVMVSSENRDVFVHTATAANIVTNSTFFAHDLANDNPGAIVLVTQNWNPVGTYNDHAVGVWYSNSTKKWAIFNQDIAFMPESASFNILVIVRRLYLPITLR
jgi:hypothetical protein